MIASHESFPRIPEDEADKLADILAAFPIPKLVGDAPPSADFIDGFNEFRTIAVGIVLRAGGVTGE